MKAYAERYSKVAEVAEAVDQVPEVKAVLSFTNGFAALSPAETPAAEPEPATTAAPAPARGRAYRASLTTDIPATKAQPGRAPSVDLDVSA